MKELFYPKLAFLNIKNNRKFYYPYILTIIGTVASFYIFAALASANDLPEKTRYQYLSVFMSFGTVIAGIFAVIFLFYTNSFLIKRRKKELGLYNILGMDKRNIGLMLGMEHLYIAAVGIGGGLAGGILLQRLVLMFVSRVMKFDGIFGMKISLFGIAVTLLLFGAILTATYIHDLRCLSLQKPVELLHGGAVGEKEPKTKWVLTIIGLMALLGGYAVAVLTKDPVEAFSLYFGAVILVIIGTYCLFTAGSITVLKLLRKNKRYYYKTSHFISISSMMYRMKRNAVGLANICILSCMVIVMISSTLSLYAGTADMLSISCPNDVQAEIGFTPSEGNLDYKTAKEKFMSFAESNGIKPENVMDYTFFGFAAIKSEGKHVTSMKQFGFNLPGNAEVLCFITLENYNKITKQSIPELKSNEVLCGDISTDGRVILDFCSPDTGECQKEMIFDAAGKISDEFFINEYERNFSNANYIVVADEYVLNELWSAKRDSYIDDSSLMKWVLYYDTPAIDNKTQADCIERMREPSNIGIDNGVGKWDYYRITGYAIEFEEAYALNSGFFFLGIFLGILFIMATVLIIYYKQVSEGYEDRERFQIMQKVGLPNEEIKRSVNRQILTIFFMPLLVATVHVMFDFPIITVLLKLFGLDNAKLTLLCTGGTFLLFIIIYTAIYALTSRVYYKIVK